jgi:uncharacterized damage-inducible protein DinB
MSITKQIAEHLRSVFTGGNWTAVNIRDTLADVTFEQAIEQRTGFNTIAALVFHTHYYVAAILKVLQGGALEAHDKFSFDLPALHAPGDWENLVQKSFADAAELAALVEQLPDSMLTEDFTDKKYGSYYRNLHGLIEHTHYHLGQMVLLKKMNQQ